MASKKIGPNDKGFKLDDYVLYQLNQTSAIYNEEMANALKRHGIETTQWRILTLLEDQNPSTIGELSRRSVTKMPTITRMVIRMEQQGLVTRRAREDDRRIIEVFKTKKADSALKIVKTLANGVFERTFDGITAKDIAKLSTLLLRMQSNLQRSIYEQRDVTEKAG